MIRSAILSACLGLLLLLAPAPGPAPAQEAGAVPTVAIPNFWDPRIRLERPEPGPPRIVRFLTDDEYPPLHFAGPDGSPTGFSVELARAICAKLGWTCTIQARRFDTLAEALAENRGDVLAAALSLTAPLRARFAASQTYFRSPARFVTTRGNVAASQGSFDSPAGLRGRRVAVVAGSAHAAFLDAFMPFAQRREASDLAAALTSLRSGDAEYLFGDGVALAVLLGSENGGDLGFVGGPYLESRYFGEGIAFLLRREDALLRRQIDYALQQLWEDGSYAALYLRFFPAGPF